MSGDEDGDIEQCGTQTSAAARKEAWERMRHALNSSPQQSEPREPREAGEE